MNIRSIALPSLLLIGLLTPPSLAAQAPRELYQTQGYGYVLNLAPEADGKREVTLYSRTSSSLLPQATGFIDADGDLLLGGTEDAEFLARLITDPAPRLEFIDGTVIYLDPLDDLPSALIDDFTVDPEATFQVAWELVDEYFSLFPLLSVDWRQSHDDLRTRVDSETTDTELFDILTQLLQPLNDGHTSLKAPSLGRDFSPGPIYPTFWAQDRLLDITRVLFAAIDGDLISPLDGVVFGSLGDFGYLGVTSMSLSTPDERLWESQMGAAIDAALASLSDKKGLVLDLRLNPGGSDHLSVAIAKRFTDQTRLGYTKSARVGATDEFGMPQEIYYAPEGVAWSSRPVAVLTSRLTASAAEVATMMLGDLPNVTLIGEPTYGVFSNGYTYGLPNGWLLDMSTEKYVTSQGIDYEQRGYPVDLPVTWSETALDQGRDNILQRAIEFLETATRSGCTPSATVLCLRDDRFAVEAQWRDFEGRQGTASAAPINNEFGHFSFFNADNVELTVKVLDGRDINNAFWIYLGSLSNVEFKLTVTDTQTGASRVYRNPLGSFASFGDVKAFPVTP